MSYPERMRITAVSQSLADLLVDCHDPHKYIWLVKAQSALTSAAYFLCEAEVQGKQTFFLPLAIQCVKEALQYVREAFNRCGLSFIRPVAELLQTLEPQQRGVPAPGGQT